VGLFHESFVTLVAIEDIEPLIDLDEKGLDALDPHDRLEIFVVNDGKKDDTWFHIQGCSPKLPRYRVVSKVFDEPRKTWSV